MSAAVLIMLKEKFGDAILETHSNFGDDTARVTPESWKAIADFLCHDPAMDFDMFIDLCGVDYPSRPGIPGAGGRMEVVMHLYSTTKKHRVRLKTRVGDEDMENANLDSVTHIWPGANCCLLYT